jgi:hypothetical protein
MSPIKVLCPRCQAALSATPPFPAALRVRCSCCGNLFALATSAAARSGPSAPMRTPVPVAVAVSPPISRPQACDAARNSRISAVVAIGVLGLVACGVTLVIVIRGGKRTEENEAAGLSRPEDSQTSTRDPSPIPLPQTASPDESTKPSPRWYDPAADSRSRNNRWAQSLSALAPDQQRAANQAIERGIAYLKGKQANNGGWPCDSHAVGYAALPGLTLLECGVPASDPAVQKAASFVRSRTAHLEGTYELALAVLFLERLGDGADRLLIRELSLRLVAGQLPDGGWNYSCPVLDSAAQEALLARLERLRPAFSADLFKPVTGANPEHRSSTTARKNREQRQNRTAALDDVPALQETLEVRHDPRSPMADNSNTQFALLALWAAQRQGLPVERSLALVVRRFRPCQNDDGGWGYHSGGTKREPSKPSMTCVGLLGLAVGHGLGGDDSAARGSVSDPQIEKALHYLAKRIGKPSTDKKPRQEDLYFLWSLERVGVLYGLRDIDGKDWYAWGTSLLQAHQSKEGNWQNGRYHGSTPILDTCFALLFLQRANLVHDLTKKIEFLKIELRAQE